MDEIIRRGMAVKIRVIQDDPYEKGRRAVLNYGHTLGHALEKASGYSIRHGEAVAIGMVAAARLSEKMQIADNGLAGEISDTLIKAGLPVRMPDNLSKENIIRAMKLDKKRFDGKVRLVLPVRIGEVQYDVPLDDLSRIIDV